ncbi:hypothetical protein G6F31_019458 [Rhizopus arrhizus]|nr:hypothetical protein G6F31_019458 [Rhizopus arrhizus]
MLNTSTTGIPTTAPAMTRRIELSAPAPSHKAAEHQQEQRHAQHERQPAEAVRAAGQACQQHLGRHVARQHHHPDRGGQAQVGDVAPLVEDAGVGQPQRHGDRDHAYRRPADGVAGPAGGPALQAATAHRPTNIANQP